MKWTRATGINTACNLYVSIALVLLCRSAGNDNVQEAGWGTTGAPIQSRAFKVLQKITDTDVGDGGGDDHIAPGRQGVPMQQQRKLQLNEDDRALMNKFKAQGIYY
ncbi:unnamed protein product, partial [Timema podura]|nr:unnamed protein product [Timema podura]